MYCDLEGYSLVHGAASDTATYGWIRVSRIPGHEESLSRVELSSDLLDVNLNRSSTAKLPRLLERQEQPQMRFAAYSQFFNGMDCPSIFR